MLLFETRTVKKLLARNVMYDPRIRKYNETDETVVIPSDYEGGCASVTVKFISSSMYWISMGEGRR